MVESSTTTKAVALCGGRFWASSVVSSGSSTRIVFTLKVFSVSGTHLLSSYHPSSSSIGMDFM